MSIALVEVQVFSLAPELIVWRVGGAVTQRSAKPFRRVRLSYVPPNQPRNDTKPVVYSGISNEPTGEL